MSTWPAPAGTDPHIERAPFSQWWVCTKWMAASFDSFDRADAALRIARMVPQWSH